MNIDRCKRVLNFAFDAFNYDDVAQISPKSKINVILGTIIN